MHIRNLLGRKILGIALVLYTLVITFLSMARIIFPIKVGVANGDKIGHFLAYFGFAILWFFFFFFTKTKEIQYKKVVAFAFCIPFLYGLLMEFCQGTFTDYRSPDWKDAIANTSGIIFALLFTLIFKKQLEHLKRMN